MRSFSALISQSRPYGSHLAVWLLAASATLTAFNPAWSAGLSSKRFIYQASNKKLPEVLQDFAASQGLPLIVDPSLSGTVNADFNAKPEEFLNAIARTYGTIWYFDGTALFVYPSSAMQSKVFRMRGYDRQQVRQLLASLGLGDARFPLRFDDNNQTLLAYGPPRHIELVSTVVEQLERDGADRVGRSIRIFPLRYASAADRHFGNSKVPGLARTLNEVFAPASDRSSSTDTNSAITAITGPTDKVRTAAAGNFGLKLPPVTTPPPNNQTAPAAPAAPPSDPERPLFQPEESTNSIIVRGLPDRMAEYEALIRQLDVAQDLVEIEATIIDVTADEFDALGIDFNFSNRNVQFGLSPGSPGSPPSSGLGDNNITTVIRSGGAQLISRIRALEGNGKAQILARPKVLGVANRMATMSDKRVASVRVAGNLDANLFSIETGTTLQVTPQILAFDDHREVRLSLAIRDGSFDRLSVDQIPVVKQTEIETEATIREGESLLVGGISHQSDTNGISSVPGLSRLPLIGAAFRHRETTTARSERLFLITPKVVPSGGRRSSANTALVAPAVHSSATEAASSVDTSPTATPAAPKPETAASAPANQSCPEKALGLSDSCASGAP
ncbi:type III secretion system outer membrane ring subunit SctC [Paucibacter sp. PLA-PC-4]|uniref:type III secretion system outer membrane ring subunit SctC n=1 Tax=Paucibacter sp. PLA-PC-4 TaxID=2993655 RepID=UPI00224B41B3|nr:type III secretion system outer membrane ring subunit SctC [Paucibacter sp. PLA-PC-4]MCX2865601.1 type III secretion system outer membrane ring subunit SctC [Paucibacter sp. PLA-PC-4]